MVSEPITWSFVSCQTSEEVIWIELIMIGSDRFDPQLDIESRYGDEENVCFIIGSVCLSRTMSRQTNDFAYLTDGVKY